MNIATKIELVRHTLNELENNRFPDVYTRQHQINFIEQVRATKAFYDCASPKLIERVDCFLDNIRKGQ